MTIPGIFYMAALAAAGISALSLFYVSAGLAISLLRGTSAPNIPRFYDFRSIANSTRTIMLVFLVCLFLFFEAGSDALGLTAADACAHIAWVYGVGMLATLAAIVIASVVRAAKKNTDTRVHDMIKNVRFSALVFGVAAMVLAKMLGM